MTTLFFKYLNIVVSDGVNHQGGTAMLKLHWRMQQLADGSEKNLPVLPFYLMSGKTFVVLTNFGALLLPVGGLGRGYLASQGHHLPTSS